jgi:serine/threonine protein phosphatase 1
MHKHYGDNEAGRDFVVGDIHGCTEALQVLLAEANFDTEIDRLFAVGDLADRGPDSIGALALLQEPWFHAVRGNHEQMLIDIAADPSPENWNWWIENGGLWAKGITHAELQEYAAECQALPLAISVGEGMNRFNVIHAEFMGDDAAMDAGQYDDHVAARLMWGRSRVYKEFTPKDDGLSMTFCGHTIVPAIMQLGQQVYIDTGAFATGALSLIEVVSGYMWQTRASDEEARPITRSTHG